VGRPHHTAAGWSRAAVSQRVQPPATLAGTGRATCWCGTGLSQVIGLRLLPYPMPPGAAGAQGAPRAAPPARRPDAHQPDLPQARRLLPPGCRCHLVAHAPRTTRVSLTFRRRAAGCRRCAGVTWWPTAPARVWHTPSCDTRRCAAGRAGACLCAAPCRACTGGACPLRQLST